MDETVEKYLKSVVLPEYESPKHQQELRRKLLNEMERRRMMASRKKVLRIVYIFAALICVSALAIAGIQYSKWRFEGKKNGAYVFIKEPEERQEDGKKIYVGRAFSIMSNDPNFTMSESDIEQTKKDLEEVDALREQGKREVVAVVETELEGEIGSTYINKYTLADGREVKIGENKPGEKRSKKVLSVDPKEVWELRKSGKGELLEPVEKEVEGKIFTFERYKIRLSDGREIIHSVGEPKTNGNGENR